MLTDRDTKSTNSSYPCPVLPEGMVVVRREDLSIIKIYRGTLLNATMWAEDGAKISRLLAALEEKP